MSYTHVLCNRGAVHALDNDYDSEHTVCGKEVTFHYDMVSDPITCKVCARSLELSRDYRLARGLSKLVQEAWQWIAENPQHSVPPVVTWHIAIMKQIVEGE